jgi:hypothetical protein
MQIAVRLLVVLGLGLVVMQLGYLAIALGDHFWALTLTSFLRGEERILQPADRRGQPLRSGDAAYDFFASQHVPGDLTPQPMAYRLWSAKLAKVSAAPKDWPKELPDKWGTRDEFSDYALLPEGPSFLQAGLLGNGEGQYPYWARDPDSALVLHHDKIGSAGRLRVTRIAGPGGRVVWDTGLALGGLEAVMVGPGAIAFVGTEPNPQWVSQDETARQRHEKIVMLDVPNGKAAIYDLTAESVGPNPPAPRE